MKIQTITIPKREYEQLKMKAELDIELLTDITKGIRDILTGKVKEI